MSGITLGVVVVVVVVVVVKQSQKLKKYNKLELGFYLF